MAIRRQGIYPHNISFNKGSLQSSLLRRRFSVRSIVRPGSGVMVGRMGSRRGGFFGSVFKGIKKVVSTVAKVPVLSTIAKTALSSLPVVGQVMTAANAVKKLTASGVAPSAQLVTMTATPGVSPLVASAMKSGISGTKPKKRKKAKRSKPRKKAKRSKKRASSRGSAKQRAARARFARAAKKGRIKKGQKL